MPGHALAALSVYPELSCSGNIPRINEWGIFPDIYCAGNEKVFAFLEDVLTEVTDLFPGEYIHIGGDEAPKARWEKCAACQARMKAEKLKDEHELQSYFVQRIEKFLNGKGKKIIGWDEILEGGLAPNAAVMSWRGEKGGIAAAKANHHVVMTPTTYLYFDYYQAKDRSMEPYCQGGNLPLQTVYNYEPYPAELTPEECKYIMGVQANLWTEYIGNVFKADYMLYPRALALSEIAWSDSKDKDYTSFTNRLSGQLLYLDKMGVTFRIPEPLIEKEMILDNLIRVHLKTLVEGSVVLYTVDGTDPLLHGKEYHEDIMFDSTTGHSLMCVVQLPSGRNSAVYTYDINQQK